MILFFHSPLGKIPIDSEVYTDIKDVHRWLETYFAGALPTWRPQLHLKGTHFQLTVWQLLETIPYGETVTYGQLARWLSPTMSAQAVGQAVHRNPCPIIIPCHRVVGTSDKLTGYALGLELKSALLEFERNQPSRFAEYGK